MEKKARGAAAPPSPSLPKSPTGISGFDAVTGGGLPTGRPTLLCGGAGSGKTLFAMEFLVKGAALYNEPGLFISFEETPQELIQNTASLGFKLDELVARKKITIDHVHIERSEIEVTGEYDLEGLFVRLGYQADAIGAKRIVLDTLEALFAGLPNEAVLRSELRRLFRWLKERGLTAVITGEQGKGTLTRYGLEEYVSDCVIFLDQRITEQVVTRRLRIVKYRGTLHGSNEYPFLIERHGVSLLPITSLELTHGASTERLSTGIGRLDAMLNGKGYYKGSSVLFTGTAGAGKSTFAAAFADSVCSRGQRCLYLALEESERQIVRNMRSVGMDLDRWVRQGLLKFHTVRPTTYGLEMHLVKFNDLIETFGPAAVVMDPISNLISVAGEREVGMMLARFIDTLKTQGITAVFTNLSHPETAERTEVAISSLIDTWILLRSTETDGERNRTLNVIKSRGMRHSNQVREFMLSSKGIEIVDVYVGEGRVFTGVSRVAQEAKDRAEALLRGQELELKQRELERKRDEFQARAAALKAEFEAEEQELKIALAARRAQDEALGLTRRRLTESRAPEAPAAEKEPAA